MTPQEHKARHVLLHAAIDELLADYIDQHPDESAFLTMPLDRLLRWSHEQSIRPTENPRNPTAEAATREGAVTSETIPGHTRSPAAAVTPSPEPEAIPERVAAAEEFLRECQAEQGSAADAAAREGAGCVTPGCGEQGRTTETSAAAAPADPVRDMLADAEFVTQTHGGPPRLMQVWPKELSRTLAEAHRQGEREATRRWAHWRDGVQYVGTCGTTLAKALAEIDAQWLRSGRPFP